MKPGAHVLTFPRAAPAMRGAPAAEAVAHEALNALIGTMKGQEPRPVPPLFLQKAAMVLRVAPEAAALIEELMDDTLADAGAFSGDWR